MAEHMIIADPLYGNFEVEGVFQDLVISAPFQRLKDIHQGGAIFLINPLLNHTRFDHSLGVYWLVTRFGGSIKERVSSRRQVRHCYSGISELVQPAIQNTERRIF